MVSPRSLLVLVECVSAQALTAGRCVFSQVAESETIIFSSWRPTSYEWSVRLTPSHSHPDHLTTARLTADVASSLNYGQPTGYVRFVFERF